MFYWGGKQGTWFQISILSTSTQKPVPLIKVDAETLDQSSRQYNKKMSANFSSVTEHDHC